jgi:hypothetical protein
MPAVSVPSKLNPLVSRPEGRVGPGGGGGEQKPATSVRQWENRATGFVLYVGVWWVGGGRLRRRQDGVAVHTGRGQEQDKLRLRIEGW